ncbi:immunity protein YezG family protein [Anaerosinus massiliensis]|uniref:immunity protein YezG family protein n=1 Tax=Massilibacillus massiliensis TaxID=1806837 RepID=UPI000DA6225D|nr:immunity protein YezG family protein [Massilibacillus massiliensis]
METDRMEQLYREIANNINHIIPEEWKNLYLYAEIREGYASVFFYYYPLGSDTPVNSLEITDKFIIDDNYFSDLDHQLYNVFRRLSDEFKFQKQEIWTNLTLTLSCKGDFKINYEYDDVSQISPVEKKEKWKAKYLGL